FVTAAELKPTDVDTVARAVSCERRQGRAKAADRWLSGMKDVQRTAVTNALAKGEAAKAETATGDFVVSASWDGGADLDIARVDARWEAELVPVDDDLGFIGTPPPRDRPFDRGAAASSLANVSVRHCAAGGQVGTGHVVVTFSPNGRVTEVIVDDPTFASTP